MHMAFLNWGFKNLQWYGMTLQSNSNIFVTLDVFGLVVQIER